MDRRGLMYVSELIDRSWLHWREGEAVIIDCQTGKGKTHFILNTLKGKILYLYNRISLGNQLKGKVKHIDFKSYQKLAAEIKDGNFPKKEYDYVVYDECHYLFHDSMFNSEVDYVCRFFHKGGKVNIYMSSTMDNMTGYLKQLFKVVHEYEIPRDYGYITPYQFECERLLINTINKSRKKWIIFIDSIARGREFKNLIQDSEFVCSVYKDGSKANKTALKQIEKDERFDCKCLIATKALDNGINIIDEEVRNVVIYSFDKIDFVQMLGRVRTFDQLNLYIYKYSTLYPIYLKMAETSDMIHLFNNEYEEFCRKYNDNVDKVNACVFKVTEDKEEKNWELIENGFQVFILKMFQLEHKVAGLYKDKDWLLKEQLEWINKDSAESIERNWFLSCLSKYAGRKLFAKEQEQLTEEIKNNLDTKLRGKKMKEESLLKLLRFYQVPFTFEKGKATPPNAKSPKVFWVFEITG
jgi:superfamily II DNA or RNA helicase